MIFLLITADPPGFTSDNLSKHPVLGGGGMYVVLILAAAVLVVAVILMLTAWEKNIPQTQNEVLLLHRQAIETISVFHINYTQLNTQCGVICKTQDHYFS